VTGRDEAHDTLVAVTTEPDNKFTAEYLHERLMPLTMAERDRKWTDYLLREQDDDESHLETLVSWTFQNGQDKIEPRRAELVAIGLSWVFTVSNRPMRDRATKALATLLSVRLDVAAQLVTRFAKCNDEYVLERRDGFLGEYPWHPVYKHIEAWVEPSEHGLPIAVQLAGSSRSQAESAMRKDGAESGCSPRSIG
jgi:hypothetical protein